MLKGGTTFAVVCRIEVPVLCRVVEVLDSLGDCDGEGLTMLVLFAGICFCCFGQWGGWMQARVVWSKQKSKLQLSLTNRYPLAL